MLFASMFAPEKTPLQVPNDGATHPWALIDKASTFAADIDSIYNFITVLNVICFVGIVGAMIRFMVLYKRRSPDQKTSSISHNGRLEFLWSAIPAVLLIVIFYWAETAYMKMSTPPQDAIDIRVTGRKWYWTVDYPNNPGVQLTSNVDEPQVTLIVPKGKPVRLVMTSEDVIHSFYVPAFRVKKDVVPGRYTSLWFEATKVGKYNVFCTEYCGDKHSMMTGIVEVVEPEDYDAILEDLGKIKREEGQSMVDYGKVIWSRKGCNACHSLDGAKATGPTWKGIWGTTESMTDGSQVKVDDNYIMTSINEPNKQVVQGYAPQMPSFAGQLDNEQMTAVIELIKSLK